MTSNRFRSFVALGLALTTASMSFSPVVAGATDGKAIFSGRVLHRDGITPRSEVVVILVYTVDGAERNYRAEPSSAEGAFILNSAPAGSYMLLVETEEGVFLAAQRLDLVAGENEPMVLTLEPAEGPDLAGLAQSGGLPRWAEGLIAGLIAVAAFVLFEESTDSVDSSVFNN